MNSIKKHPRKNVTKAFTLIELLVVMSIIVVMMALLAPSFVSIGSANNVSKSVYDIAGILDQARTYAMANNTFVYVGIAEADSGYTPSATTTFPVAGGIGKVVMAVVASKDGTRGYDFNNPKTTWNANYSNYNGIQTNAANLVAISKLQLFDNMHMVDFGGTTTSGNMARPGYSTNGAFKYTLGASTCVSQTPFDWPLGKAINAGQYSFSKVIYFDPQGVARIQAPSNNNSIAQYIEIGLQQTHGSVAPPVPANQNVGNQAAIQINCATGTTRVYRP